MKEWNKQIDSTVAASNNYFYYLQVILLIDRFDIKSENYEKGQSRVNV